MRANRKVFESVIGDSDYMCRAIWEPIKPQIDAYVAEKDETIAEKNEKIAEQGAEIERLKALLAQYSVAGSSI